MRWCLLLVILFAMTALPTCSAKNQSKGSGKIMLTYTRWGDPAEMESTRELIAEFERENPDIEVRVDVVGWEQYWQKMKTATVTNSAQDVWLMSPAYIEQYAEAGHILDLMPFIKADPTFNIDDYFPGAFNDYSFTIQAGQLKTVPFGQGGLYAFTRDNNCGVLYYNRDHFDAVGLAYPTADWTWDDLVTAAKKLTIDFDGDGVIDQWGYTGLNFNSFGGSIGADFLDYDAHKSTYSSPLALKAITFCHDLIYKYKVHAPPRVRVDQEQTFVTGKASMTVEGIWNIRSYCRSDYKWDIAPIPLDIKGRVRRPAGGGVGHSIFARSPHPKEAWRLVKFLSGPVGQRALAKSGTSIPVLKSAAYSKDFLAGYDRPPQSSYHVIFDCFAPTAVDRPRMYAKGYLEYTRHSTAILDEVWRNTITPQAACQKIDEEIDAILAEQYPQTAPRQ
jgi:multiple sugar transport system substrate-binding protein